VTHLIVVLYLLCFVGLSVGAGLMFVPAGVAVAGALCGAAAVILDRSDQA
jgi:hypothetical protein